MPYAARDTVRSMPKTNAARLRKDSTDAERALWAALRNRRLGDSKFRRQHPLGPYVVDFACISHRLVVEVDGGQHAVRTEFDSARTQWLTARGYRVVRFWNHEVLQNIESVKRAILEELSRPVALHAISPSPRPSPPKIGGEGDR